MRESTYNGLTLAQVRRSAVIDKVNGAACAVIMLCCVMLAFGGAL